MAGDFGLLVILMTLLLLVAGFAINVGLQRGLVSMRTRRRAGVVAVAVACLVPLVAFTSVALSGNIDDRVSELTSETEVAPDEGGDRVFASSSTRGKYWREAGRVFDDRPATRGGCRRLRRRASTPPQATPRSPPTHTGSSRRRSPTSGITGVGADDAPADRMARGRPAYDGAAAAAAALRAPARTSPARAATGTVIASALVALSLAAIAFGVQS